MKLELVNFGCFESRIVELPDHGTVLIKGRSGTGKSTIVTAINFAIYGAKALGKSSRDLTRYGAKGFKVVLEVNNCKITRLNGKDKVTLEMDGKFYEKQVADEILRVKFPTPSAFYLDQHQRHSILRMKEDNQLSELEMIACTQNNAIANLKQMIDNLKVKYKESSIQVNSLTEFLAGRLPPEEGEDELNQLLAAIEKRIHEYEQTQKLVNQNSELVAKRTMIRQQIESIGSNHEEVVTSLRGTLNTIEEKLQYYRSYKDYKNYREYSRIKRELEGLPTVNVDKLSKQQSEFESRIKYQKKLDALPPLTSDNAIADMETQLQSLQLSTERHECPECNTMLYLDTTLKKCSDRDTSEQVIERISKLQDELEHAKKINRRWERLTYKIEGLHTEDVSDELKVARDVHESRIRLKQKLSGIPTTKPVKDFVVRDDIESESELNEQNRKVTVELEVAKRKNREYIELQSNLYEIEEKLRSHEVPLNIPSIEEYRDAVTELRIVDDKIARIPLAKTVEQLKNEEAILRKTKSELTLADYLVTVVKQAERETLSETIQQINHRLLDYTNEFYDDQLTCKIILETKSKTKLKFRITGNSHEISLGNLSGGEQDRLLLALTSTLADITEAPFMILDESISSLDMETTSNVFNAINKLGDDNKQNRLILYIAHQIVEGHYDRVLDLD
jgi:DNA repair exonuclease SbcCD ATPase subunit